MLKPPKGMTDYLFEDAEKLEWIMERIRNVFIRFGFRPFVTPALERFEVLSAKGGLGEAVKDEIYWFEDKSGREIALRFDHTMPLARIAAAHPDLKRPIRRYCIGRVWRYDNPQRMRKREFWQADVDIVGSESVFADVECVGAVCQALREIGFSGFRVRVNNRKLIESAVRVFTDDVRTVFRIIDKLDKIGPEKVRDELSGVCNAESVMRLISLRGEPEKILSQLKGEGKQEILEFFSLCRRYDIPAVLDLSLVRGLEYYTSLVFEIDAGEGVSFGGGGRYDSLIGIFGRPEPATGMSIGVTRVFEALKDSVERRRIFVAVTDTELAEKAIDVCAKLRSAGIPCEYEVCGRNLKKQMEYADRTGACTVVILGKKELEKGQAVVRNMINGKESTVSLDDLPNALQE
ncbi:MAG: histidine--tRNA ligase [Candidatus Micrarchaeota archaeon]|nr:histidine--tRNA ligase [Candidatus Micrarchaeota archaeon]